MLGRPPPSSEDSAIYQNYPRTTVCQKKNEAQVLHRQCDWLLPVILSGLSWLWFCPRLSFPVSYKKTLFVCIIALVWAASHGNPPISESLLRLTLLPALPYSITLRDNSE